MKKTLLLITCALIMSGCSESTKVKAEDLQHHRFILVKANGESISPENPAEIVFGENMHIMGNMCNRFVANATFENQILKAPGLAMTKMLCPDTKLNELDATIEALFTEGANVELNKDTLTLKNKNNELVYQLKDLM